MSCSKYNKIANNSFVTLDAKEEVMPPKPTSFSFACSGWLKMYLFGVAKFLQDSKLSEDAKLIGSSGGALAATGLALGCNFDEIKDHVLENVVAKAHESVTGAFKVRAYLHETLTKHGSLHKHRTLNAEQRLSIVYTVLPSCSSRRVTNFEDSEALRSALIASCCAPPIAGLPFFRRNELVIDGGLSDFQPIIDSSTVTISPFYCTHADIRPSTYVPLWWAIYPPGKEQIKWVYELGYKDAQDWAMRRGYVTRKSQVQEETTTNLFETTFGRFTGYRTLESRVMDVFLVCFVIIMWKPLAFMLMYTELCGKALISGSKAAVFGAACRLFGTMLTGCVAASLCSLLLSLNATVIALLGLAGLVGVLFLVAIMSGGMQSAAEKALDDWQNCVQCLRIIISLSLFLRSIPVVGSSVPIKRHEFLYRHSLVYRLTLHFV